MELKNYKSDTEGIWIPKEELQRLWSEALGLSIRNGQLGKKKESVLYTGYECAFALLLGPLESDE